MGIDRIITKAWNMGGHVFSAVCAGAAIERIVNGDYSAAVALGVASVCNEARKYLTRHEQSIVVNSPYDFEIALMSKAETLRTNIQIRVDGFFHNKMHY
jgi:hypothetical protein